jgi:high-affinity iron transporter
MIAGIATASGRAGAKLPIGQFFTFCAYTVLLLAVIFTGKGVIALQESGVIAQTSVNLPTISVLGVYPTLQSIGAQVAVLLLTVTLLWRQRQSGRPK